MIQSESYGCDTCKTSISLLTKNDEHEYLDITVFHRVESGTTHYQCCSWVCVFKKLKTLKTDYFISLPFLKFDTTVKGQTARDFFKCLR